MAIRFSLLLLSLLTTSFTTAFTQNVPADMQLFLLVGQSNMAGRGMVEPEDEVEDPHIFMQTKEKQWVPARDPMHFDKPKVAGVGPGLSFARTLLKTDPNINIGMIPAARGGSNIREWKARNDGFYAWAMQRAKKAGENGTLRGILWHQGEADCTDENTAAYAGRFSAMIQQMRTDLGNENLPVVIGELGYFNPTHEKFNANLPAVAASVPHCALVSAEAHLSKIRFKRHS